MSKATTDITNTKGDSNGEIKWYQIFNSLSSLGRSLGKDLENKIER